MKCFKAFILIGLFPIFLSTSLKGQEKVGIVLSGGGAAAISHVGFLKALEENNIPVDYITGTSMGALIGGFYASGFSPTEIDSIVRSYEFQQMTKGKVPEEYKYFFKKPQKDASWITLKFFTDSLLQTSLPTNLINPVMMDLELMEKFSGPSAKAGYDFDSLFVPFRCVAADIDQKKKVIFRGGNLNEAIRASLSYPFYLKPIEIDGRLLFDGGLYNNFPSDVMYEDFLPDVIIGNNLSDNVPSPEEDDVISQIKNMLIDRKDYSKVCENGVIVEPEVNTSTFDFSRIDETIEEGYQAAIERMDEIKEAVRKRSGQDSVQKARKEFRSRIPSLKIGEVEVKGVKGTASNYVKNLMNIKSYPITKDELKPKYFRVFSDNKIKYVFPTTTYVPEKDYFRLELRVKREKDLFVEIGGNVSSRPINTGYLGVQYNYLGNVSFSLKMNSYFGKFYGSVQAQGRFDFPVRPPFYLEPLVTLNRWDFFKSSTAFFEDVKPSFLVQEERFAGLRSGVPIGVQGKLNLEGYLGTIENECFQNKNFNSKDTADRTRFDNFTVGLVYERSTLNRKQYPTKGSDLVIKGRLIEGTETTLPGSTSPEESLVNEFHQWMKFKVEYENYFKRRGWYRMGFKTEAVVSNQLFFDNYTGTILSAPAYQPVPEQKTLFHDRFRAYKYLGFGLKNIFKITNNLNFRLEGYAFQPYRAILKTEELDPKLGPTFSTRYFVGSGAMVYHSPLGPVSVSANYYDGEEEPWSILFNFGYLIFNNRPLE